MSEITLVRHGQANSSATDEAGYDRLTELGRDQARWLGEHLAGGGQRFDLVLAGTMRRQADTALTLGTCLGLATETDKRLNELNYFAMADAFRRRSGLSFPNDRDSFVAHAPQLMTAWSRNEIAGEFEPFAEFEARIAALLQDARAHGGRVLLVTSGGVVGMAMRQMLRLDVPAFAHVMLQVRNASLSRFVRAGTTHALDAFNAVPHLDRPDRTHALTWL
jgi:broad specificity phosphatase PhoE